jgi:hypothetical protein
VNKNISSPHEEAASDACSCGKPRLPNNPFCKECDLKVLIIAREMFPDAADEDFEREVPRG